MSAAISEICEAVKRGFTVSCEPYKGGIAIRLYKQEEKAERPELPHDHHYAKHCEIDPARLELCLVKMPLDKATRPESVK